MTLLSLRLSPRGSTGWTSGTLSFGRTTTVLLGPNGAGKTPIIKALMYALGHPVELPPLVREKCEAVALDLVGDGQSFRIERRFTAGVDVTVTGASGATTNIYDERNLSDWVLPKLGVSLRTLSGKKGGIVAPYMSVVGPMFLVDQDVGWTSSYVPFESHGFVKDQREEVLRWLLEIPARHRPVDKSEFQEAKTALAGVQEQIAFKRRGLETLYRDLGPDRAPDTRQTLEERKAELESKLAQAHSIIATLSSTESSLDKLVREATQIRDELSRSLANATRRKRQLAEVQAEVGAELGALEQNEVAAEAFRVLCGNENCQFFRKPEDSYGRRVLYLKDQLKDFEFSRGETERELGTLTETLREAQQTVSQRIREKAASLEQAGAGDAIRTFEATSRELSDVHLRLDRLARLERERKQLDALVNKEAALGEEVANLRPTGKPVKDNSRLLDARQILADTFKEWLLALQTPNVPADVLFDEELRLFVSGERFSSKSSHSGSTRTRLVLAYHATLLETSLRMGGCHPRLLVLDAPRQHELSALDLRAYIKRFHKMATNQDVPVQLVLSATDPDAVPQECVDALWTPQFHSGIDLRFLGPAKELRE